MDKDIENMDQGQPNELEGGLQEPPVEDMFAAQERKKKIIMLSVLGVVAAVMLTYIFWPSSETTPEKQPEAKPAPASGAGGNGAAKPGSTTSPGISQGGVPATTQGEAEIVVAPDVPPVPPPPPRPEIPSFKVPVPPPPIPPSQPKPVGVPESMPGVGGTKPIQRLSEEEKQRMSAAMVVLGGQIKEPLEGGASQNGDFFGSDIDDTNAASVKITKTSDHSHTILQGKIIDAVLETAINTELPGILRALVSRDVYAESGKAILIPKGSRLIGSYSAQVRRGQARVYITWNRVIRPDGTDINLGDGLAVDNLGRSGIKGDVDSKFLDIISNSILLSALNIAFAKVAEEMTGGEGVTQGETGSGDTTTSGKASDVAANQAVQSFGSTVQGIVQNLVNVTPVITVDQGTKIKIFVNKDIIFPPSFASDYTVIR